VHGANAVRQTACPGLKWFEGWAEAWQVAEHMVRFEESRQGLWQKQASSASTAVARLLGRCCSASGMWWVQRLQQQASNQQQWLAVVAVDSTLQPSLLRRVKYQALPGDVGERPPNKLTCTAR
jgi:hypothetical protein